MPVLIMYVSDAASSNKTMVNHEVDGAGSSVYVVHAHCLAHQAHLCARTQHVQLGPSFVTHLSSASRVFAVGPGPQPWPAVLPPRGSVAVETECLHWAGHSHALWHIRHLRSYQHRFQSAVERLLTENLTVATGDVDANLCQKQHDLLAFLVARSRGAYPAHARAAVATVATLLNGQWSKDAITRVPQRPWPTVRCHGSERFCATGSGDWRAARPGGGRGSICECLVRV